LNKVGGHSVIYKFSKQAVCKVCIIQSHFRNFAELFLVSASHFTRELVLRVCGVESTASPRTHTPLCWCHACQLPKAQCNMNKLAAGSPRQFADENIPFSSVPIAIPGANANRSQNISEDVPNNTHETEMLEDCNCHIISEWMLHGGKNRSFSHSNVNSTSCVAQRRLWGVLPRGTASSPDLTSSTMLRIDHSKPNLLTPLIITLPFLASKTTTTLETSNVIS